MAGREKVRAELDDMGRWLQFVATHLVQAMARLEGAAGGDGYPSGSGGGGGSGGTAELTPVERAAAQRMRRRGAHDPATADLRRLEAELARAGDALFRLQQSTARYVPTAQAQGGPAPVTCQRCGAPAPGKVRRDLCAACYTAWHRAGKPQAFSA